MLLEGTALQRGPQLSVVVVVHTQQVQKGFSRFLYTRITTIYWTIGMLLSFYYYVLLVASFRWRPSFVIYWYWCCYLMLPLHNWTIFTFPLLPPILALLAAHSHKYQTQISLFFARPDKSFLFFSRRQKLHIILQVVNYVNYYVCCRRQTQSKFSVSFEKGQ